jgi:hypothetical protein
MGQRCAPVKRRKLQGGVAEARLVQTQSAGFCPHKAKEGKRYPA